MPSYKIEWKKSTKKDLRKIPVDQVSKMILAVEKLVFDPYPEGFTKLSGSELSYRIRIGDYRVVYEVLEKRIVIEIMKVKYRKNVYRH